MGKATKPSGSLRTAIVLVAAVLWLAVSVSAVAATALEAGLPVHEDRVVGSLSFQDAAPCFVERAGSAVGERVEIGRARAEAVLLQSGHSYHTTGAVVSADFTTRDLELAVSESTEGLYFGERISVRCASAEYFDMPFEDIAPGMTVQVRSVQPCSADGTIVAQKVFVRAGEAV